MHANMTAITIQSKEAFWIMLIKAKHSYYYLTAKSEQSF